MGKENAEIALSLVGYEEELKVCFLESQFLIIIIITFTAHISKFFFWYLMPSWILKTFSMPFRLVLKFFLQFFRYYLAGCVDHLSGKFDFI